MGNADCNGCGRAVRLRTDKHGNRIIRCQLPEKVADECANQNCNEGKGRKLRKGKEGSLSVGMLPTNSAVVGHFGQRCDPNNSKRTLFNFLSMLVSLVA